MMRKMMGVVCAAALVGAASIDLSAWGPWLFLANLQPHNEVPAVSSPARGRFSAVVRDNETIDYRLSYEDLQASVVMSHIHFAQPNVNGGIMVWLCGTASNPGPAGTQVCPQSGTITGTITPADIQLINAQGIAPNEFDELVAAMRSGLTYVNVHSTQSPGGEIRGQLHGFVFGKHHK